MTAHTRPRWLSVVVALWLLLATAAAIPAAAQSVPDLRGTWLVRFAGDSSSGIRFVIKTQSDAGAISGRYLAGDTVWRLEGRVSGDQVSFTTELTKPAGRGRYRFEGTIREAGGPPQIRGTAQNLVVSEPVDRFTATQRVERSAEGGTRASATTVACDRDMTVPPDQALLRCDALVTDASGQPGSRIPTGTVTWTAAIGRVAPARCILVAPIPGGVPSCHVTLSATSAEIPIGTDVPVTASYAGDTLYAPSTGAPRLYGASDGFRESELYGPTCNPATTSKPNVGCGDPVNPGTGNLSMVASELAVPGRGPMLEVVRTYGSLDAAAGHGGRFGVGWSDAYGARIELGPRHRVTVHLGTGASVPFTATGKRFSAPGWATATLARGPRQSYVLTLADQRRMTFDRTGRLIEISDRTREPITLDYADDGCLASAADASGRALTFTCDPTGHVVSVTDPAGRSVGYGYGPDGDLVMVTDVAGGRTTYAYDARHRLALITDPTGATTRNAYDDEDRVTVQTDPMGNTLAFDYHGAFPDLVTLVTDGNGHRSGYQYRAGVLVSQTSGLDSDTPSTTRYVYDADLGLVTTIDANGQPWRLSRDAGGYVTSSTDPLGRTTTFSRNKRHDLTSVTSPTGVMTRLAYDEHGLVSSITVAAGTSAEAVTSMTRADPAHPADITSITDPLGSVTAIDHDEHGAVVEVTDALGSTTTVTRDMVGRLATFTDALGAVTSVVRDPFGDPTSITDQLGATTQVTWDGARRQVSATDPLGHVTATGVDAAGRPVAVTLPDGTITRAGFDAIGDITTQQDGNGGVSTLAYDSQRRPTSWTDPLGNVWRTTWDMAGHVLTTTDPVGHQTSYAWDAAGQLIAIDRAGTTSDVTYTYDADGRRLTTTDSTGTTTYAYDPLGRLASVTDGAGKTVAATYDRNGHTTSITYPDGGVVERDHDARGQLVAVRDWLGHETTFTWDAAGRLVGMHQGDGSTTTRGLDARGDLLGIDVTAAGADQPFLSFGYARDALGRVSSESGSLEPAPVAVSRDARGRLLAVGDAGFQVDAADRLVGLRGNTLAYDAAGRLLSASGPRGIAAYSSDAAGQRTSARTGTGAAVPYTWDAAGRLIGIGSTSHTYDGDGLRMTSTLADGSTSTYAWFRAGLLPVLLGDGASWFIQGPDGMPIEEVRADGSVQWLHTDQMGSVRAVTDEGGSLTGTFSWDPYGLPRQSTGVARTRLGFQGGYTDPDTGLQYLLARYYDPATGQFLSVDPAVLSTRQPFAFANDDPLTFTDPAGTQSSIGMGGRLPDGMGERMLDGLGLQLSGATCDATSADLDALLLPLLTMHAEVNLREDIMRARAKADLDASMEMLRGQRPIPTTPGGLYAAIQRRQAQQEATTARNLEAGVYEAFQSTDPLSAEVQAMTQRALNDLFGGNGALLRGSRGLGIH